MKTGAVPDGDIAPGVEGDARDLIACQPELLASFAQIQPAHKHKIRAGHYLKRALLSSGAVKNPNELNGDRTNVDGEENCGEVIAGARSQEDLRCSLEQISHDPWFNTWPNRDRSSFSEEQNPNFSVPLEQVDLPIVYDPQTKGLHLASSSRGHFRAPEGSSYSSNVSSLSDASPTAKEADEEFGCYSLPNGFGDALPSGDYESADSVSTRSRSDDAELKRKGIYGLLSKWKVKSDDYWNLFSRSDSASSSPSRQRSDTESSASNDRVLGSTALMQLDRPQGLPAKDTMEAKAHTEEHDKIITSVRKRELKEAKLRKKQLQCQLKAENELVRSTRVWNHEILPKWSQTKNQKRTLELWWQGIPPCIRGKLWRLAIPNDLNITKELFEICLSRARERLLRSSAAGSTDSLDDFNDTLIDRAASLELIQLDISRTFPHLCIFQKQGPYYDALHGLLAAYVCYRPDIGYVQGMSFIAAVLILNMDAPDAFICFANFLNRPCHRAFYCLDQPVMEAYYSTYKDLLAENAPQLAVHFDSVHLTPDLYLLDWVYTVFAKAAPLDLTCRIWDLFLRDGDQFLFRTALGIMKLYHDNLETMDFLSGSKFLTKLPEDLSSDQLFKMIASVKMSCGKLTFEKILQDHIDKVHAQARNS